MKRRTGVDLGRPEGSSGQMQIPVHAFRPADAHTHRTVIEADRDIVRRYWKTRPRGRVQRARDDAIFGCDLSRRMLDGVVGRVGDTLTDYGSRVA